MTVLLSGLPIPPSSNNCYLTDRKSGRRFPSQELKKYHRSMIEWRLSNLGTVKAARALLVERMISQQKFLRIDRYFAFRKERLLCLDGTAKRLDASNRIKILDDSIATEVLGLDDCWFVSGFCEKVIAREGSPEEATVCISKSRLREDFELVCRDSNSIPWAVRFARASLDSAP